jgi:hypothetical protein
MLRGAPGGLRPPVAESSGSAPAAPSPDRRIPFPSRRWWACTLRQRRNAETRGDNQSRSGKRSWKGDSRRRRRARRSCPRSRHSSASAPANSPRVRRTRRDRGNSRHQAAGGIEASGHRAGSRSGSSNRHRNGRRCRAARRKSPVRERPGSRTHSRNTQRTRAPTRSLAARASVTVLIRRLPARK